MPIYTDPTLYSSMPSYALYLSNPYSSHSSLLNSYNRPSFSKPLPSTSRFHRGFKPLATISENPATALLRRKYSPHSSLHSSANYKAPRPIQINTADIDVSANKYRPHRTEIRKSPEKTIKKSPTRDETPPNDPIAKPIRRDRATVRLHTFHSGDSNKTKKWRQNFNSRELATEEVKPTQPEEGKISRNSSFHDICRAISQDSINEALNPGQPEEVTRKQSRTFSTEDIIKQIRRNSADILKENIEALDKLISQEDANNNLPKKKIKKKEENFEPRGSIKRKKKVMKKKTGDIEESEAPVQRRASKKIKATSSNTSLASEVNEELPIVDNVRDISDVHVEQIKTKSKPIITSTVDVEETKSNLKFVVDDVLVEESPKPKPQKKFKFNVTVQVEEKKPKLLKKKIERKGRVCVPKTKGIVVTDVKNTEHRGSLGDICEGLQDVPKKKELKSVEAKVCVPNLESIVVTEIKNTEQRGSLGDIREGLEHLPKEVKEELKVPKELATKEQSKSCSDLKPKEEQKSIMKSKATDPNKTFKKSVSIEENQITKSKSDAQLTLKDSPKKWLTKEAKTKDVIVPGLKPKEDNPSMDFWDVLGTRGSVYNNSTKPLVLNTPVRDEKVNNVAQDVAQDVADDIVQDVAQDGVQPVAQDVAQPIKNCEESKQESENKIEIIDKKSKDVEQQESDKPKKLVSKRSLVNKATNDDPDLEVFVSPPKPPTPEPQPDSFVPLQSNRLSQWMHPFKKPEQYDECPVEIYATPKTIRKRHYPKPRHPPPPQESESDDSDNSEDSDEEDDDSSDDDEGNVGKSTSSNDSGFNSSNGRGENHRNKDCDVNIHRKCEKLTANLCGINQKMIVEAIESVKKGSTDTRDSPTSNPAHNPAFSLDACDPVEEFQMSSTYVGFQKSGRITPPATTIPRFRKYAIDDFNFLKVLGKGSFGKVLLAELKDTEYYYAVKCLKKDVVLEDDDVECTLIERKVLALGTKHPYLCHLLCTFQTESHLFFVMEYLNGGDLMFHIQQSGRFPEHRARFYGAEIVSGLKFLHAKGIVYRDLKLDNILLDFDGHVRIADFGMCKLQIFLDRTADTFCGTPDYMAPEIIKGQHYNQCVDWWSFGVLLYEMLIGQSPFSGCDEDELFWSICNEKPVLPRFLSSEANLILTNLLEKDAGKRLGNKMSPHGDIQDHQFFRPIAWDMLEKRQLEAPFKPDLQHPLDTQYFDRTFTVEKAKLTPIENNILQSMDQTQFQGFSYTNPNATDR